MSRVKLVSSSLHVVEHSCVREPLVSGEELVVSRRVASGVAVVVPLVLDDSSLGLLPVCKACGQAGLSFPLEGCKVVVEIVGSTFVEVSLEGSVVHMG